MNSESAAASSEGLYSRLQVIGTSTPVDKNRLPHALAPVYQDPSDPDHVFFPIEEGTAKTPRLGQEISGWFDEQCELGEMERFHTPFPAKSNHLILQFWVDIAPEYIARPELDQRLRKDYLNSLQEIEICLEHNHLQEAAPLASRALCVASQRDSLPSLLQLAIYRAVATRENIQWLETELRAAFTDSQINDDWIRFGKLPEIGQFRLLRRKVELELNQWVRPEPVAITITILEAI